MEETRRVTYSSIETNLTRSFLVLKEHLKTVGVVQLTQSNVLCLMVLWGLEALHAFFVARLLADSQARLHLGNGWLWDQGGGQQDQHAIHSRSVHDPESSRSVPSPARRPVQTCRQSWADLVWRTWLREHLRSMSQYVYRTQWPIQATTLLHITTLLSNLGPWNRFRHRALDQASNSNAFNRWTATEDQKKAWQWPMMRGDARCKSTPLHRIHVGCIRPWLKRFGKPMQIPCWRRHVPWSAQTLYSSMIVIFHEFELIAVVCEDFSYHPFRLAACSPEEMLEP